MAGLELPYQWAPRLYQRPVWEYLARAGKRAVLNWHRRSGKDDLCLAHISCAAMERPGNYWYMLPKFEQARKAIWEAINPHTGKRRIDERFPEGMRARTIDNTMTIHFQAQPGQAGSTFQVVGADTFKSLVGAPPVGLVFSEMAKTNPSAWAYLMPILEENQGWVIFNSTPEGDNHFRDYCDLASSTPGWFYQALTADETGIFTPTQLQEIERQLQSLYGDDYGHALFLQEYYCSFDAAIPGSIWGADLRAVEARGGIGEVGVDLSQPVWTAWDLGRTDDTAVWFFQVRGGEVCVLDFYADSFAEIPEYLEMLQQKRDQYGWRYATHWLPHDARPRRLGMGGKSILQQFTDGVREDPTLGRFAIHPSSQLDLQEGIQAGRATFRKARFHGERCKEGLRSLRHYHRVWDDDRKVFEDRPYHDWASHAADAWRYLSLAWATVPAARVPDAPWTGVTQLGEAHARRTGFGKLTDEHLRKRRQWREERMPA